MPKVTVQLRERSYDIEVGYKHIAQLGAALERLQIGQQAVVITNPGIKKLHGRKLTESLKAHGLGVKWMEVADGEASKSARSAFELIEKIAAFDVKKSLFVVAFGGGVIGDLAGYVAASYRRGIPYVQVPTTLLAQIDSAIGGKVGVDLPVGKNLMGAFYQPRMVWSDVALLESLDQRQIRNGLAEAIKYGVICDKNLFDFIDKSAEKLLTQDSKFMVDLVTVCSRIKAKVVMNDEYETKGMRTILNFGHTVGHAIEAANRYKDYQHGEAVALGMHVAVDISCRLKLLSDGPASRVHALIAKVGLPEKIAKVPLGTILKHMEHDKKFRGGKNKFVLATGIGSVKVKEAVPMDVIRSAIKRWMA